MGTTSSVFDRKRNPNLDILRKMVNSIVQTHDKHLHESACLILAANNGRTDVIQHMLQEGCNIDQQDEEGYTAICEAAYRGQIKTIEFLIKHCANLNIASTSGMTPLLSSLQNGHFDAAQLLIQNKADVNASAFTENALLLSMQWKQTELAKRIRTNGGKMNYYTMIFAMVTGAFITLFTKMEKIGLFCFICSLAVFRFYYIDIFNVCVMPFLIFFICVIIKYEYTGKVGKQRDK